MRIKDCLALAGRGLYRGLEAPSVLFTAAAVAAMCFSGAMLINAHSEKAKPCELFVTAPSYLSITEQTVQDLRSMTGVADATGTVEVPATVTSGDYTAALTLIGIDRDYLDGLTYTQGDVFPEDGAMPWIILSDTAAKSFVDPADTAKRTASYMPKIDWLAADLSLDMGGGAVFARVSGLFESDGPAAYMGLDIAKTLLQSQGQPSGFTGARVRVTNAGAAGSVSEAILAMGYGAADPDGARPEKWDAMTREAAYLAILGAAGLLCSGMLRLTGAALHREEESRRADALRWAGVSRRVIRGLSALRGAYLDLTGAALGTAVHCLTAALVALDPGVSSGFALTLPAPWLPVPAVICVAAGMLFSRIEKR